MSNILLKEKLFDRVKRYNIDKKELNKAFKKVCKLNLDEVELNRLFDIEIEKYMIKQIKKGEIKYKEEIKNANQFLKVMIQRDKKHKVDEEFIDKLYENAIDVAIDEYNDKQLFNILIFKYMKSLSKIYKFQSTSTKINISNTQKKIENNKEINKIPTSKTIDNKTLSKEIIDSKDNLIDEFGRINAKFLMLLILNGKMNKLDLMNELKISYNMLLPVLNGKSTINEKNLSSLYKKYKVTNVYDLKRKIAITCGYDVSNMYVQKIDDRNEKETEKVEIKEIENTIKEDENTVFQEKVVEEKVTELPEVKIKKNIDIQHQFKEKNISDNSELSENKISNNNIFNLIKKDVLNDLIHKSFRNKDFTEKEYIVACLLFRENNGKYYSKEEISRFLYVDENTINKIYLDCLTKYRDYYNNLLDNNINKLKLENEEN